MGSDCIHICPADDTMDHDRVGHDCWCRPTYDIRHDRTYVVHNRADELYAHAIGYKDSDNAVRHLEAVPAQG